MNMTVKKPITVLLVMCLGLSSVLGLIMTIEADVFTTYMGLIKETPSGTVILVCTEASMEATPASRAYWYINRQTAVFDSQIIKVIKNNGQTIISLLPESKDILACKGLISVTVDIQTGTTSVLDRLFQRGVQIEVQ
jgi:hypothetical protein